MYGDEKDEDDSVTDGLEDVSEPASMVFTSGGTTSCNDGPGYFQVITLEEVRQGDQKTVSVS
jgi:hypothetical protein